MIIVPGLEPHKPTLTVLTGTSLTHPNPNPLLYAPLSSYYRIRVRVRTVVVHECPWSLFDGHLYAYAHDIV